MVRPLTFWGIAFLFSAGCGTDDRPPIAHVEGVVTLDDQPLPSAHVTFLPDSARRSSTGVTDPSGHFELTYLRDIRGAVVGQHRVRIQRIPVDEMSPIVSPLPRKYNQSSELTATVTSGDNVVNFSLSSH